MRRFQACLPVIPRLQGEQIEAKLETLFGEADGDPQRYRQFAAIKYYLQYTLWECENRWSDQILKGVSNYTTLLDAIEHRRLKSESLDGDTVLGSYTEVLLVTFNYDTLLEVGLKGRLGFEMLSIPHYIEDARPYKLIKVHGSTNWVRDVEGQIASAQDRRVWAVADELIERVSEVVISNSYRILPPGHPFGDNSRGLGFPAIAIPVEDKRTFECPEEHLAALRAALPKIEKILIIGWRGFDRHFGAELRAKLRAGVRCLVVADTQKAAKEIADRLGNELSCEWSLMVDGGFSDLITRGRGVVDDFLRQ